MIELKNGEHLCSCRICGSDNIDLLEDISYIGGKKEKLYSIYCADCGWTLLPQSAWSLDEIIKRYNSGGTK